MLFPGALEDWEKGLWWNIIYYMFVYVMVTIYETDTVENCENLQKSINFFFNPAPITEDINQYCFFFFPRHSACGILVPWTGIEPGPSAVKAWSPNHWTARKFPILFLRRDLEFWPILLFGQSYHNSILTP